jgi:uncharacterized protein (TIGR02271 family)
MTKETFVAVYDNEADAAAAVKELENAGIPSSDITHHANDRTISGSTITPVHKREPGFWARLFGFAPEREYDSSVYDRSLERGSSVVMVNVEEQLVNRASKILERHNPIDIDERAAGYMAGQATQPGGIASTATDEPERLPGQNPPAGREPLPPMGREQQPLPGDVTLAGRKTEPLGTEPVSSQAPIRTAIETSPVVNGDQTMELAEEKVVVGKRAINRGTTRVRRYVVETPVEEPLRLREETVSVERRPVNDRRPVTDADFSEKVVEMSESDEEPVVSKTAQVREELVIHKEANERTETVRDNVRREEAEVTRENGEGARERGVDEKIAKPGINASAATEPDDTKR